jgi:SH3-like domain-containing protein
MFRRAGLPVQIIAEANEWRQVRDAEGATGWVLQSQLSGRRTALVLGPQSVALRSDNRESAGLVATIEAGVIASIRSCDGRWCEVAIGDYRGFIEQPRLWGVAPNEVVRELR